MTHANFRWNLPAPIPASLNKDLDTYSPPFRSILFRRGCRSAEDAITFLLPHKPAFPPHIQLGHLELACQIIAQSVADGDKIAVFGDYDTDGITATALLTLALQGISADVRPYIPNRLSDGYGLSRSALEEIHHQGCQLLITVDNGIRSLDEVGYAKSLGIKVIITDHHQPPSSLPGADAIINPKLPGDPYPNKNLAGVGVAYKLICRLAAHFPTLDPEQYLDLVALGTIADIVPLSGENRYLAKQGLLRINQHSRLSLSSLLGVAGISGRKITASDISFQIAPRINASGRLGDETYLAPLELLLSKDKFQSGELAQIIEIDNERRRELSRQMQERIESQFASDGPLPWILISLEQENHQGVAGITAGYLTNKYYLPAIVGKMGPQLTTASCRSIPEFDLVSVLEANQDLFSHFGGHTLAAGFTIENQHLPQLQERLLSQAKSELEGLDLAPSLEIDAVVNLGELDHNLHKELLKLEPTGEGNPQPIFVLHDAYAKNVSRVGKSGEHLKFLVSDGLSTMPAISFGLGSRSESLPESFSAAFHFNLNEFRGKKEYQLQVLDLKPS